MRNLKRVLSLALALVMVLGMMVITTSAADFADDEEITYTEAVDVISAIGVITGDNGKFYPTRTLTREEGAALICYLLLGKDKADKLTGSGLFADVAADRWSAGEIEYCANLGFIGGYTDENGDTVFNPKGELTGVAYGKLLLCALGYDAAVEGYGGTNWASAILTDMVDIGLDIEDADMGKVLTREQAAEMTFQALTKTMVKYDTKGTSITVNGMDIVTGASSAEAVTVVGETNYDGTTIAANGYGTQQFCEKYFKYLHKDGGAGDDFGRNASHGWWLDADKDGIRDIGERVYNEMETADVVFTADTAFPVVANKLAGYTFGANDDELRNKNSVFTASGTIGEMTYTSGNNIAQTVAALTGNGKVVEIYADRTGAVEDVVLIGYTVETVTGVSTNKTTGDVTYTLSVSGAKIDYADDVENTDQIVLTAAVSKGDVVTTVTGDNTSKLYVYPTTKVVGAQSAYNTSDETVTVAGTVYTVANGVSDGTDAVSVADFTTNSADDAKFYLDQYGYLVKTSGISNIYTNYAQIKGTYVSKVATTVDGATPSVEARFVLADGTVDTYEIKLTYVPATKEYKLLDSVVFDADDANKNNKVALDTAIGSALNAETVYAYEIEDGVIDLQAVATVAAANTVVKGTATDIVTGSTNTTIASKNTLLNEETVYVLYNATKKTATTYVGALPAEATLDTASTTVVALVNSANSLATAKVVFGYTADVAVAATRDYAYIDASEYTVELIGKDEYAVYEGIKADGTTVTLYGAADGSDVASDGMYTWNADLEVTGSYTTGVKSAQAYTVEGNQIVGANGAVYNTENANVIYVDPTATTVDGSTCVVVVEMKGVNETKNAEVIYVVPFVVV